MPSLCSINLLEQLAELRESVYLLGQQFIAQDLTWEQPDRRAAQGEVSGKGLGASIPSPGAPTSQHLPVFTNLEPLLTCTSRILMEVSLLGVIN